MSYPLFLSREEVARLTGRSLDDLLGESSPWTPGCGTHRSGVYFLFGGQELNYVGKSVCIGDRLRSHATNRIDARTRPIPFDKWTAIEVPELWLDPVEQHYIEKHRPPFNIRGIR